MAASLTMAYDFFMMIQLVRIELNRADSGYNLAKLFRGVLHQT